MTRIELTDWLYHSSWSLKQLLEFCYVCGITPLQVLRGDLAPLRNLLHSGVPARLPQHQHFVRSVDHERRLALNQAAQEGREEGLQTSTPIAKRSGDGAHSLLDHFSEACHVLARQAQAVRQQRKEQCCQEVRRAVVTLYQQEIFPSLEQVSKLLASPNTLYMPEAYVAWHEARRELGLES